MPEKSDELTLDGIKHNSYEDYVLAKRRRNQEMLLKSGLLEAKYAISTSVEESKAASTKVSRGIKRRTEKKIESLPRRKSSRIAGIVADNIYVEKETTQGIEVSGLDYNATKKIEEEERFYGNRMNDGSNMSVKDAASFPKAKWLSDTAVDDAISLIKDVIPKASLRPKCPNSVTQEDSSINSDNNDRQFKSMLKKVNELQIDNEKHATKVVPERIYSVCFHPSKSKLIGCAGDKVGNIGLWNVNSTVENSDNDGVSLFKPHSRAISSLQWNSTGTSLYSLSYDSTIKELDVESQTFNTMFATYDSNEYIDKPGYYNMDGGWLQYGCLDNRNEQGYFLSTSYGDVLHLDFRSKKHVTFHSELDEKKINTISLHTNGYSILTAGLSRKIQLFDIRNLKSSNNKPVASHSFSKSVNSAHFSPSGSYVVATTMSDTLDIYNDFHLKNTNLISPNRRIVHNNQTGRWLATLHATWHPSQDIFVVGSMAQPRCMEIFNENGIVRSVRGEMLNSVASRCCFHPSMEEIMCLGGNSSGKVFLLKK